MRPGAGAALALGLAVAGCGGPPVPTDPPVSGGEFEGTLGPVRGESQALGVAVLEDVRVGAHPGFVRTTFTFQGSGVPGYEALYVEEARGCGSGYPVELGTDALLQLSFQPAQAHTDEGEPTVRDGTADLPLGPIGAMARTCDFEGQVTYVLGTMARAPFRVSVMGAPPRVVVDLVE